MRLGAPLFSHYDNPNDWAAALKKAGFRAAYCPVAVDADDASINAYAHLAHEEDIIIAEIGAWCNPLSSDPHVRSAALDLCKRSLLLAEKIGAICCVNIAGSRGAKWDGPHPANLTRETFEMVVNSVQEIIDAVQPTRTFYCLETMPWIFPDSPESYLELLAVIDRPAFAVHLDPANLVCSPQRYFANTQLLRDCFNQLGPRIKSCHAKDILIREQMTTHLDEVRPGLGALDYHEFLRQASRLPQDMPIMLEHLNNEADYSLAAAFIRSVAREEGLSI